MKINFAPIKYNPISYNPVSFNGIFRFRKKTVTDTFEKNPKVKRQKTEYPFSFSKDVEDYKKTPEVLKKTIMDNMDKETKTVAKKSIKKALILKTGLDKRKGEGEYTLVSIGTSPSGILRALDYMGEDVRYVPLSGLRECRHLDSEDRIKKIVKEQDHRDFKKYLDSIGISAENINNGDKKFLFYDFTYSGATISTVRLIATEVMGIDRDKAEYRSLNDDIRYFSKNGHEKHKCEKYIDEYLSLSEIEKYTGIPHINYKNTNDIVNEINAENDELSKDFNFALCYYLEQEGLLA